MADVTDAIAGVQAIVDTVSSIETPAAMAAALASVLPAESGHSGTFLALSERFLDNGRPDVADALLQLAASRDADNAVVLIRYAESARRRSDWPEMLRRTGLVRERFPNLSYGFVES